MKILFCTHNSQIQGAPLLLLKLSTLLKQKGHNCYFCSKEEGPLNEGLKSNGIEFCINSGLYLPAGIGNHPIHSILKEAKPDIVFVNTILGDPIIREIKNFNPKIKVIWLIHESDRSHIMESFLYLTNKGFSISDAVVFVSEMTKHVYEDLNTDNFHVINNGISVDEIDKYKKHSSKEAVRNKHRIPTDALVITTIGSMVPRKGQREFVESGIRLLRENKSSKNIHFVLVGEMRPTQMIEINTALSIAKAEGIRNRFHFFSETTEIFDFFFLSDIFVCNSFIESFPLVILEAMVFGLPIIAPDIYGIKEQIEDNKSGLLFLPGNRKMLTGLMNKLINDPNLAATLGINAYKRVTEYFASPQMLLKYEELMENLMKKDLTAINP
ncbi:glycosyltransferase family 4 protein [Patescibacteria group bacterium]|nr:glycosyltransferase family 4 protein [Patescibacteria group bacterium]MBU1123418.1 glycosyltransferase family 4 protein [Patescibacteria group bacterium]MBU1911375.1 glycosyltransferase family 4 protein [Patescibacteria group bacterium]